MVEKVKGCECAYSPAPPRSLLRCSMNTIVLKRMGRYECRQEDRSKQGVTF